MKTDTIFLTLNLVAGINLNVVRSFDPAILFIGNLPTERSRDVCSALYPRLCITTKLKSSEKLEPIQILKHVYN